MGTDRKEYLLRPLIEGVVYEITDNLIRVSNFNTLFINLEKGSGFSLQKSKNFSGNYEKSQRITPDSS